MINKKGTGDKERILGYLIRKGSLCNSYKVARELEMERFEVLEILNKLAQEGKVRLRSGSVRAITRELNEEEKIKTKSEVEELSERVEKLEKTKSEVEELEKRIERLEKRIDFTFSRLREILQIRPQKISKENISANPENIKT